MTTVKAEKIPPGTTSDAQAAERAQVVDPVVLPAPVKRPVFRDKEFTSRTLILPNKRTVQVVGGLVEATDLDLLTFLRARSSFELVTE